MWVAIQPRLAILKLNTRVTSEAQIAAYAAPDVSGCTPKRQNGARLWKLREAEVTRSRLRADRHPLWRKTGAHVVCRTPGLETHHCLLQ